jgi:hypothetical protein
MSSARLLERVFDLDLEHCPNCGGELKIMAAILEQPVIEKILTHLGLQARAPPPSPRVARRCRPPEHHRGLPVYSARSHGPRGPGVPGIFCTDAKRLDRHGGTALADARA